MRSKQLNWRGLFPASERQARMYPAGTPLRVLRGALAGQVLTVRLCTPDEIRFVERPTRDAMSKENVEPVDGPR